MFNTMIAKVLPHMPRWTIRPMAMRYIAGETRHEALAVARELADAGFHTTIDRLGEDEASLDQAAAAIDAYIELMEAMAADGIERNVSVKLSQFGIRFDPEATFGEFERLLATARRLDFFVRIDMEDSSVTDVTLDWYRRAWRIWPRVGTVLQARLKRTPHDARKLAGPDANIRLCKGIYMEPAAIAHQDPQAINASYLETLRILLDTGCYTAVATHDLPLLAAARQEVAKRPPAVHGRVEYQALLGVPIRSTLERLEQEGETVRLYLPFGPDWYAYSLRRLEENPQMAGAIARSVFRRDF